MHGEQVVAHVEHVLDDVGRDDDVEGPGEREVLGVRHEHIDCRVVDEPAEVRRRDVDAGHVDARPRPEALQHVALTHADVADAGTRMQRAEQLDDARRLALQQGLRLHAGREVVARDLVVHADVVGEQRRLPVAVERYSGTPSRAPTAQPQTQTGPASGRWQSGQMRPDSSAVTSPPPRTGRGRRGGRRRVRSRASRLRRRPRAAAAAGSMLRRSMRTAPKPCSRPRSSPR